MWIVRAISTSDLNLWGMLSRDILTFRVLGDMFWVHFDTS